MGGGRTHDAAIGMISDSLRRFLIEDDR